MKPTVHIMRGISGSGKSTLAKKLAPDEHCICSADAYFTLNGVYEFDAAKLGRAHSFCFDKFTNLMMSDCPVIVVDNTNTMFKEFSRYIKGAEHFGYDVVLHVFSPLTVDEYELRVKTEYVEMCAQRNSHSVPLHVVMAQAKRFELTDPAGEHTHPNQVFYT